MKKLFSKLRALAGAGGHTLFWALISVALGGLSIWAVLRQARGTSIRMILSSLSRMNPGWLLAAALGMLGFIVFEAMAIRLGCGVLDSRCSRGKSLIFSSADIYFSAITPSATGGQPACICVMMGSGISGVTATAVMLMNLTMYTLSTVVMGICCFALRGKLFLRFGIPARVLILTGCGFQLVMALVFFLSVKNEKLLALLGHKGIALLRRLHLVRHPDKLTAKLDQMLLKYRDNAALLGGRWGCLGKIFLLNFLQRISQIAVTMFVYLAAGGGRLSGLDVLAMQGFVALGSNFVPIPGGMGVADYLMLDGFGTFLTAQAAVDLEFISRSLSFYLCIILCGLMLLMYVVRSQYRARRAA